MIKIVTGLFAGLFSISAAIAQPTTVGTLGQNTVSYPTGAAIAKVVSDNTSLKVNVQPGGGFDSLVLSTNAGDLDFAIAGIDYAAAGIKGTGTYKNSPTKNIRVATVLMPSQLALAVRADSGIKKLSDLKGKRVTHGWASMQGAANIVDALLANGGLTYTDIVPVLIPNSARANEEFVSGNADALLVSIGASALPEIDTKVGGIVLLPIDSSATGIETIKKHYKYSYVSTVYPKPGLVGVTDPLPVLTYDQLLITNTNVSDNTVYELVKSLYNNKTDLVDSFWRFRNLDFSQMYKDDVNASVPYHPGALKFYKEINLIKN